MPQRNHLLKSKRFLPLFVTQFFGAFNDNAFKNAFLIWFTFDIITYQGLDATTMVSLAAGFFILPFFIFSVLAGQIADCFEKSWLTQQIKLVEILLMIACAMCFYFQSVPGLLIILFLMGLQSTFFGPVKYSLLPEHLNEDELMTGNGLIEAGTFLSILFGTIFGGFIIRTSYGQELLSLFVILFAIIGWISSRSIPISRISDPELKINWNVASETLNIIGYARRETTIWSSIIGISWFWLVGVTFLTLFPVYTKDVIGGNEHIVTLFLTLFSIGIAIGSILCNKLTNGRIDGRLVPYGSIGMTLSIILFVFSSYLYNNQANIYNNQINTLIGLGEFYTFAWSSWGITISLILLAIFAGLYIVPLYAIIQHRTDAQYMSRVIAANNVINALFMVLSSIGILALISLKLSVLQILLTIGLMNIPIYFIIRTVAKK